MIVSRRLAAVFGTLIEFRAPSRRSGMPSMSKTKWPGAMRKHRKDCAWSCAWANVGDILIDGEDIYGVARRGRHRFGVEGGQQREENGPELLTLRYQERVIVTEPSASIRRRISRHLAWMAQAAS
jgi:hypothetical protein